MKKIIEIPSARDSRWKSWRRELTGVDVTKTTGYAFQGDWLTAGRKAELEVGSYVLIYDEIGSAKHHKPEVQICKVTEEDLQEVLAAEGWSWALDLRDAAAELYTADFDPKAYFENLGLNEKNKQALIVYLKGL